MHINHKHLEEDIAYTIQVIKARGLKVHIAELDLSLNPEGKAIGLSG